MAVGDHQGQRAALSVLIHFLARRAGRGAEEEQQLTTPSPASGRGRNIQSNKEETKCIRNRNV
jgi:hypothetical protein